MRNKLPKPSRFRTLELFPVQSLRDKTDNVFRLVSERPIASSLILLASALLVIIFSMTIPDSRTSKIAVSTTQNVDVINESSPSSTPVPDNILKWQKQLEVTPEPDTLSVSSIEKILPGQDYQPGTLQLPTGWKAEYSTSSSEVAEEESFSPVEPANGVKFIKISTDTVSSLRPVAQSPLTAPLNQQDIPSPDDSKTVAAKLYGTRLYTIYKSVDVSDGKTDSSDLTIGCLDLSSQVACTAPDGSLYPSYLSSEANTSIGAGKKDISTPMSMQYGFNDSNGRMYIPAQKANQYGVNCIDLSSQQNCGFTALQSGTTTEPNQVVGKNPVLISGFAQVGTKLYGNAAYNNGDSNRANDYMQITCFDMSSNAGIGGLCEGYTGSVNSSIPSYYTGEHNNEYYTPSQNKIIGNNYYFLLNYDQGNSSLNTLNGYSQTGFSNRLICYDILTQKECSTWPKQSIEHTYTNIFTGPVSQPVFGAIVNSADILGLVSPSQLILAQNTDGSTKAICSLSGFTSGVDPGFSCFDPEKATNTTSTNRPAGFLPTQWLNTPWTPTFNTVQVDTSNSSKLYSSLELPVANTFSTPQRSAKICYDWKTATPCSGFRFPFYNYELEKPITKDIAFIEDGGCIIGVGEANYAYSFDANTGETPCRKTKNVVDISVAGVDATPYCDGVERETAGSPYRKLVLDNASKYDFEYINISIKDSNGNELAGFDSVDIRELGSLDLSKIESSIDTDSLVVEVTTNLLNESPWGKLNGAETRNIPLVSIVLNRDPVQYCYQTKVWGPPEPFCNISNVKTASAISVVADMVASETSSVSTKEVFQQPSQQCFKALTLTASTSSPEVRPGDSLTYNMSLKNDSNTNAYGLGVVSGARLEATIPGVASFVSATEGGVLENGKVVWASQDLSPQESKQYSVTVSIGNSLSQKNAPRLFAQKAEAYTTGQNFSSSVFYTDDSSEVAIDSYNSSFTFIANNPPPNPEENPQDTQQPTAPAGLVGNVVSPVQADLNWSASSDNVGIVGYQVFRDGNLAANVSGTNYSDTNLSSGTDYLFTVKARDLAGNISEPSNSIALTTPVPDPATIEVGRMPGDTPAVTANTGVATDGTVESQQASGSRLLSLLLPEQAIQAIRLVPEQTARTVPYILILTLVFVAFIYARQAWIELRLSRRYREIENRYNNTLEANKNFVSLTSHYLNTPVTIMQASIELAVIKKSLKIDAAKKLSLAVATLAQDIKKLISDSQTANEGSSNATKNSEKLKSTTLGISLSVVIPVVVCALALGFANFIFTQTNKYTLSGWMLFGQVAAFTLTVAGLFFAYQSFRRNRLSRQIFAQQIALEADLSKRRTVFITASYHRLDNDLLNIMSIYSKMPESVPATKTFGNGVKMLEEVLSKFAGLIEYSKPVQSLPKPIILEPAIAKYLEYSKDIISTKKINIITKIQPGVMASLSEPALHQLVSSIIGNSIKFSKEGATIEIRLDTVSNKMRFIVKDTGIGIEPVKLKQLMAPFSRATDVLKFDYEGIGLSLYLNKVLLEQVGGSLEIISKHNAGTIVVVYLPDIK